MENHKKMIKEKKEETPLVSVIMATYNDCPEYINSSIESILNQTYKNIELLIMDDSTEKCTRDVIDHYSSDGRVFVYREEKKLGFVESLNKGLDLAKGKYIARMDGDDISELFRLEKQVNYLREHGEVDVLGAQLNIIDENGNITGCRKYPLGGVKFFLFFLIRSPIAHPSVIFKREIIDAGYRYDSSLKKAEDIDLWLRLFVAGYCFKNIPETLVNFRVESDFLEKRVTNHSQEDYVVKIRRKNFSIKRPIFSILSVLMTLVRQFTPDAIIKKQYLKENGKYI